LADIVDGPDIDKMDKLCSEIFEEKIKKTLTKFSKHLNSFSNFLKMKREAIADKGIWTAKKRYILNIYDNEGVRYTKPKIKVMGIEAVKSSTPSACREKLKKIFEIIMTKSEADVIKFIDDFRHEFRTLPFTEIAFPRSCNGLTQYGSSSTIYGPKTPIQVRGALVYNHYLKKLGLEDTYEQVKEGEKVKFCYLKVPNPLRENVISVVNDIPKTLNLEKYIDYNTQFEKSFVEPLKAILTLIGYEVEKKENLLSLLA
jgi:DNA polymerase elongation subunit (family B)